MIFNDYLVPIAKTSTRCNTIKKNDWKILAGAKINKLGIFQYNLAEEKITLDKNHT